MLGADSICSARCSAAFPFPFLTTVGTTFSTGVGYHSCSRHLSIASSLASAIADCKSLQRLAIVLVGKDIPFVFNSCVPISLLLWNYCFFEDGYFFGGLVNLSELLSHLNW